MANGPVLGACLTAVAVFASTVPAAADPVHARVTKYENVHLRVSDPAKAADWYVKYLGARPDPMPGRVYFGDVTIALVRTDALRPSAGSVIDHFAVSVPDVTSRIKDLTAAGIKVSPAHQEGVDAVFVEDPWGVRIELLHDPGALGFHHVHLSVADPAATLDWYEQHLGGARGRLKGVDGLRYGSVWLLATKRDAPRPAPSADRAIMNVAWRVADIHKAIAELKAKGVQVVIEPRQIGNLWYAFVEGPGGVRTEFLQRSE
jgi:catechol 2,3-dioxygenase-like lactoylglutathione lyase family enzyme